MVHSRYFRIGTRTAIVVAADQGDKRALLELENEVELMAVSSDYRGDAFNYKGCLKALRM
jgi:hypothetical protein